MSYTSSCHTASIIFSCNKVQNGGILVTANSDPPRAWPLKQGEKRGREIAVLHFISLLNKESDCLCSNDAYGC